jgi:putative ABC transport system ATP-binding protein
MPTPSRREYSGRPTRPPTLRRPVCQNQATMQPLTHDAAPPPLLRARGLCKRYQHGDVTVVALDNVDLDIAAGEFVVLLGPSGSGKSTLLNILGGLDRPTSGTLTFKEHVLSAASDAQLTAYRRAHIGFVFQFYNLIPSLTVRENLALVADITPHPMALDDAIAHVGLSARATHFPAQLSGGEQQRVAIARAIVKRPELLLCDEPTGALDYPTGKRVLEVIRDVHRELNTTVLVITHNAGIAGMAHRVIRLSDGRIASITRNAQQLEPSQLAW